MSIDFSQDRSDGDDYHIIIKGFLMTKIFLNGGKEKETTVQDLPWFL